LTAGYIMNVKNYINLEFQSLPENVAFARTCVGAFASQLDCTLEEIEEIKLAVSEAVSNCIIHAYQKRTNEKINIYTALLDNRTIEIVIQDYGCGIENIEKALEPAYSSEPGRMGLGFTFMKSFMDDMEVQSQPGEGTIVKLRRSFMTGQEEALL
jgi:stage II sporulation protein AB (anti-sigma F factor)